MLIRLAKTDSEILECFPVMLQLRLHLEQSKFVEQIRQQMKEGYQLAFLGVEGTTVGVAGFRISTCLASGKFLSDLMLIDFI